jgi:16S rRNA processing protein RimM
MDHPAGGWLSAGHVGRPHGLDGSFHVRDPSPRLLEAGNEVMVDGQRLRIDRRAGSDRRPIVRLEGYRDRTSVEALSGREMLVERGAAPELDSDEWWAEDLVGCTVRDGDRDVGLVVKLIALPSCEVLEVERSEGSASLLVPLVSDAVRAVDVEGKRIDVDLRFLGAE